MKPEACWLIALVLMTASSAHAEVPANEARFRRPGALQQFLAQTVTPTVPKPETPAPESPAAPAESPAAPATPATPPVTPAPVSLNSTSPATDPLTPPPEGGTLDLDAANLAPPPAQGGAAAAGSGLSAGPFSNIVFGGTLDYRFLFPKDMPEGMFMIHVNELFLTTNIGDHLSILAEQLLLTSDLGTTVGQDHGFVYVTISNLPVLPDGTAFRIGRLRMRYGIDSKLDGPANPLRTPEYRTIGTLSDRALEMAGYIGPIEYAAAVTQGPDFLLRYAVAANGELIGPIKTDAMNSSHPLFVRLGTDFKGATPNFGVSGFYGKGYPVLANDGFQAGDTMLFGGAIEQTRLVLKERISVDGRWNVWRLKLAGEYTAGRDRDGGEKTVQAWYARADLSVVPQRLTTQLQYDRFDDGRPSSQTMGSLGIGITAPITEESWLRLIGQGNEKLLVGRKGSWLAGSQLLFAF